MNESLLSVVDSLQIQLYKHNYIDRKILSYVKRYASFFEKDSNLIISVEELKIIFKEYFSKEILLLNNSPAGSLFLNVNSLFFINQLIDTCPNLKYFEMFESNKKNYSRVKQNDILKFDFKMTKLVIDLSDFNSIFVNQFLTEIGIKSMKFNNIEIESRELAIKIDDFCFEKDDNLGEYSSLIDLFDEFLGDTVVQDNPKINLKLFS